MNYLNCNKEDYKFLRIFCLKNKCDCSKCSNYPCPKFALYDTKFNSII